MNYLKLTKTIALLTLDNILSQPANTLLAASVVMLLFGAASPHVFGFLAVVMPWLFKAAFFVYMSLACFKAGWQMVNRFRAVKP